MIRLIGLLAFSWICASGFVIGDDWARFRGPYGSGIASDSESLPTTWSQKNNLAWKIPLPGPGASSPIIVGQKVLVTCYSGYGLDAKRPGKIENLVRHLICFDLKTGKKQWQKNVKAALPEDLYDKSGVSSHGYASHTPASDGINVYCFFGKSGVHAFDLDGKKLWDADAGNGSDPPKWGSSSSPVVHESTVIVTASAESQSIIGFEKTTGRKLWQHQSDGLDGMWGTPSLVQVSPKRWDLVMLVPRDLLGLDPETGKIRWQLQATESMQAYSSIISDGKRVYGFSGQGGGAVAVDIESNDTDKDVRPVWKSSVYATYASPVRYQQKIYVVSRRILTVVDAKTGKRLNSLRLKEAKKLGNARFGSLDYASPVIVGDRLFWLNASGQTFVFRIGDDIKQLAVNDLTAEKEFFWGSPAVASGRMVLRSSRFLYCIAESAKTP
jgi:outer membrane protein assembly factor BamB